jgi:biopolymer transport protein ExbB
MPTHFDLAPFLASTDWVARTVLAILILMSIVSWTVIVARGWREFTQARRHRRFLALFWHAESLEAARATLSGPGSNNAFANVARHGFAAAAGLEAARLEQPSITPSSEAGEQLIQRMLERGIAQGRRMSEFGLGALASVASAAPFVGLFGTVWGVYQALTRIGRTGQGTLDKVAGPIGEALIMTAFGLAVAIPAVIAYNYFARRARHLSADLGSFAGDLMALLHSGWKAPQLLSGDLESASASRRPRASASSAPDRSAAPDRSVVAAGRSAARPDRSATPGSHPGSGPIARRSVAGPALDPQTGN